MYGPCCQMLKKNVLSVVFSMYIFGEAMAAYSNVTHTLINSNRGDW